MSPLKSERMGEATGEPVLNLAGVSKAFGKLQALTDVSLSIGPGQIHTLLGENGAGKSTLCNIVFGIHSPDSGTMTLAGHDYRPSSPHEALASRIAMVHQHFSLVPEMSVVDNVCLGWGFGRARRQEWASRISALGDEYGLSVDPFARVGDLSVGERQRVEILKGLSRDPILFVLDEPTAVLPPGEVASLLEVCRKLASRGCGLLLITHKLAEIKQIADTVTVLRAGRVVGQSSSPRQDIDELVRAMIGSGTSSSVSQTSEKSQKPDIKRDRITPEVEQVQIDGVTLVDREGVKRLDEFTLSIGPGEIVAVAGVEGNGQSELAAILSGMTAATEGRFFLGDVELTHLSPKALTQSGVGVIPEDRHAVGCVLDLSVANNIYLNRLDDFSKFGFLQRGALQSSASAMMERFDVRAVSPNVRFGSLSGGNQQKAVLARELTLPNLKFLIAAQPTRGLDVNAVAGVYQHIRSARDRGVAVLLISSELDELINVADRIIVLYRGRIVGTCAPHERDRIGSLMAGNA